MPGPGRHVLNIRFGHGTHNGLRREHNEDAYTCREDLGLWIVADGMGGHQHGEVASRMAIDTISEQVSKGAELPLAIQLANEAIIQKTLEKNPDEPLPMGSTVVAVRTVGEVYDMAWVGDSRIYLYENAGLRQLSRDHSYVNELLQTGAIDADQARNHPHRNVITQALGVTAPVDLRVESSQHPMAAGQRLLLCSDGLSEEVPDVEIESILSLELEPQETVDQLIQSALGNGGSDNITVLLLDVQP